MEAWEALLSVQAEQAAAMCRMPDTTEARICWRRPLRSGKYTKVARIDIRTRRAGLLLPRRRCDQAALLVRDAAEGDAEVPAPVVVPPLAASAWNGVTHDEPEDARVQVMCIIR